MRVGITGLSGQFQIPLHSNPSPKPRSTTHSGVNKDAPLETDGPGSLLISDALSETIPEPAVMSLLLGTGGAMLAFRRIFNDDSEDGDENPV